MNQGVRSGNTASMMITRMVATNTTTREPSPAGAAVVLLGSFVSGAVIDGIVTQLRAAPSPPS